MTDQERRRKNILQEMTHKTIGEIYTRFEFILPKVYETVFNKYLLENNKNLVLSFDKDVKEAIELLDVSAQKNNAALSKIVDLSSKAINAIELEDSKLLRMIKEEAESLQLIITELSVAVYKDSITGFLNREGLKKQITQDGNIRFEGAVFSIDIDHFQKIINNYGIEVGNSVLKSFSALIKNALQKVPQNNKFFCRAGTDEFLIIVTDDYINFVSEEISKAQSKKYRLNIRENTEELIFSFGKVNFKSKSDFEQAIINADAEMIKNKRERNVRKMPIAKKIDDSSEEYSPLN